MRIYTTAVLLLLLLTNTQCKKDNDNDVDNKAKDLQGSWRLAYTYNTNGNVYPAPGSLTILKFDDYKMLTYAHDTLLKTELYFIATQKDAITQANVPCIVPALSSSSAAGRAFSINKDTLNVYDHNFINGGGSVYARYKP